MSDSNPEPDDEAHRLIDMVVEEVSLVDRAANQRRFLLVKRSQAMSDEANPDETDPAGDAGDPGAEPSPTGGDGAPDTNDVPAPAGSGANTEAVVAALEALTGVVEMLATQTTEKAKKKPAPAADDGDPEDLADGGADEAEEGDAPETPTEDAPPSGRRPPPKKKTKAEGVDALADVRAQLARIENALGRRPAKKQEPSASEQIGGKLADITKLLGDLKTQIAGQAGRLAKVEKNVGAPASKPVDGARPKPDGTDVSWPLDINAPRDRESVAKDMSFH